jgi:hypothetical protein
MNTQLTLTSEQEDKECNQGNPGGAGCRNEETEAGS